MSLIAVFVGGGLIVALVIVLLSIYYIKKNSTINNIWYTCFISKNDIVITAFPGIKAPDTIDTYTFAGKWVSSDSSNGTDNVIMARGIYTPKMIEEMEYNLHHNIDFDIRIAVFEAQRNGVGLGSVNLKIPVRHMSKGVSILELSYGFQPNPEVSAYETLPTAENVITFPLNTNIPPHIIDIVLKLIHFKTGINARKLDGPNDQLGNAMRTIFCDDSKILFK